MDRFVALKDESMCHKPLPARCFKSLLVNGSSCPEQRQLAVRLGFRRLQPPSDDEIKSSPNKRCLGRKGRSPFTSDTKPDMLRPGPGLQLGLPKYG